MHHHCGRLVSVHAPEPLTRPPDDARQHAGAQGVRSLWVVCELCHHEAVLNVDGYGDAVPVPAFAPRVVCTACGIIGAHARPNWQERQPHESLTGLAMVFRG